MNSNIKILIKFSIWFLSLAFICFYGIFHVSAETYDAYLFNAQLYDNVNGSLSTVTTSFSNNYWTGTIPYMPANQSGAAWGFSSPIPLIENHTYSMTVFVSHECGNTVLSSYNRIGVGSSFNEAKTSYQNNSNVNENLSKVQSLLYGQGLQFAFTTSVNANYIVFPFATSVTCNNVKFDLNNITIEDLGSSGVSETTINNSLSNQTNNINSNSNNNRDMILNNQASNTQSIIDNQASNTQSIIDSNKVCQNIDKNNIVLDNKYLDANGVIYSNNSLGVTDYYKIDLNSVLEVLSSQSDYAAYYCIYNINKTLISCVSTRNIQIGTITLSSDADYIRFTINKSINKPTFKICKNGNQAIVDSNQEAEQTRKGILGKIGDLISGLFDTSGPDTDSLNNMAGWLPPGPVDSILTLPLTFLNTLNNSLGSSCTPFTVSIPFVSKNLTLPCFSDYMSEHVSSFGILWAFIGAISSVVILYRYLLALYVWVDDILMMRYNFHEDFGGNSGNFGGV